MDCAQKGISAQVTLSITAPISPLAVCSDDNSNENRASWESVIFARDSSRVMIWLLKV